MATKFTRKRRSDKSAKPHSDFPLFPHATRRWAKKVRGKRGYFGKIKGDEKGRAALERWLAEKNDILASRTPRGRTGGVTIADLRNHFLTAKRHLSDDSVGRQLRVR